MVSSSNGRNGMLQAQDCITQERPPVGGSGTDTGGSSSRGLPNAFHVSMKWSGQTGGDKGSLVLAV